MRLLAEVNQPGGKNATNAGHGSRVQKPTCRGRAKSRRQRSGRPKPAPALDEKCCWNCTKLARMRCAKSAVKRPPGGEVAKMEEDLGEGEEAGQEARRRIVFDSMLGRRLEWADKAPDPVNQHQWPVDGREGGGRGGVGKGRGRAKGR